MEHIIREDYLVEGLEIAEMFLDLLLARVGLINLSNEIDPGMAEAISSVIWVQPRIITECPELKIVCDELGKKYGKGKVLELVVSNKRPTISLTCFLIRFTRLDYFRYQYLGDVAAFSFDCAKIDVFVELYEYPYAIESSLPCLTLSLLITLRRPVNFDIFYNVY